MFRRAGSCFWLVFALLVCAAAEGGKRPEVWVEVRSPHFRVASDGGEKQARRVAGQFEHIRAAFLQVIPGLRVDPSAPIIVLAAKNEKSFDLLLPQAMLAKGATRAAGLFLPGPEKNYVLLRVDAPGNNPYHTLYHEYTHLLLHENPLPLPVWLDEGLAEFYGHSVIMGKEVQFGRPDFDLALLHGSHLLPLPTLFTVTRASPYYNENNKASIFYAETWVLVHMLMSKGFKERTRPLGDYINNLQMKMDPVAAAARAFGDLKQLQKEIERYIYGESFKFFYAKTQTQVDDRAYAVRELSPPEADARRGDGMVYDGNYEGAREALARALQEDPRNVQASESMGLLELRQKHLAAAKKWFTQAIQLDSQSYLAQYYYAVMRMQESPEEGIASDVGDSLHKAITINPQFAPAYDALARFYTMRDENLEEAHMLALQAVSLEPANVYYYLTTANLLLRLRQADNAVRVCQKALAIAKQPAELAAAQRMLASAQKYQEYLPPVTRSSPQAGTENSQRGSPSSAGEEGPSAGSQMAPPPVLRRRDGAPVTNQQELIHEESVPFHSDAEQRGARDTLTGIINEVKCSMPAVMEMILVAGRQTVELFSENFYTVEYSALNFTPAGELHPCRDLKGLQAQVFFYDLKGQPGKGELISVRLRK